MSLISRESLVRSDLHVAAHGGQIEPPAACSDACIDATPAHASIADRDWKVAVHAAAHRRHRDVGVELFGKLECNIAAHGVERQRAVAGELVDVHVHGTAYRVRSDRVGAQPVETHVAAHAVGSDVALFKYFNLTLDWYDKKTTDMIYRYTVDPILVPVGNITANGGSISNKGIELSLSATPVKTSNFSWNSSINLAHNKNVITSLTNPLFVGGDSVSVSYPEGAGQSGSSLQLLKQGRPLGQFFTLEYAGKNSAGVSQFVAANGTLTTTPTRADYHYEGDAQPKLVVGWSNTLRYKDFDFNVFVRGVFGNKIFNATRADLFRPTTAMSTNILVDAADESPADGNAYRYSSRFIESGSYVRFDNATLGYNVKSITNNKYIKSLRVYTSVNNLFTITKYKGIDPEVNQGGIAPGVDYNNFYPKTRTVLFGVNVSF